MAFVSFKEDGYISSARFKYSKETIFRISGRISRLPFFLARKNSSASHVGALRKD
jgi:hypothetical protein